MPDIHSLSSLRRSRHERHELREGFGWFTAETLRSRTGEFENKISVYSVLLSLRVFAACANLWRPSLLKTRIYSRQDAKNAKFGSKFSFAVFASLRDRF